MTFPSYGRKIGSIMKFFTSRTRVKNVYMLKNLSASPDISTAGYSESGYLDPVFTHPDDALSGSGHKLVSSTTSIYIFRYVVSIL